MRERPGSDRVGLHFPVEVNPVTGRMEESSYEESIRESIYLIIMTRKGERVMRPDFGCDIHQYMFENINYTLLCVMQRAVEEALIQWEPRISEVAVEAAASEEENTIQLTVRYRIRASSVYSQMKLFFDLLGA